MVNIKKHLSALGFECKDKITGFTGVIDSVCFDLYGCIQASVRPGMDKDGKLKDGQWFDINRLKVTSSKPLMEVPQFEYATEKEMRVAVASGKRGPAKKAMYKP